MRCITTRYGVLLVVGVAAACGAPADTRSFTVRDSAGIEIVESPRPQWGNGEAWTLSPEPVLEIGANEGDDPYLLYGVADAVRFDDGTVVVANSGDNTLRYYDSSGVFLTSAGGSGGGPAEFTRMMGLRRLGDEVLVWQFGPNPSKVFDAQGNFIRALHAPTQLVGTRGVFADGSHLFSSFTASGAAKADRYLDSSLVYLSSPDFAESDSLARLPGFYMVAVTLMGQRTGFPQEYGPRRAVAVGDTVWYYGWPETYEFQVRNRDNDVLRIVRRAWEPAPVTDADRELSRERILGLEAEGAPPQLVARLRGVADGMTYPEHHPAFLSLHPDPSGHVWVELPDPGHPEAIRDAPSTWDVFDPSGAWLGSVEFPQRFIVFEIGLSHVVGQWRDEMDVQHVRVYELVKP